MKRFLSIGFAFLFMLCMSIALFGCTPSRNHCYPQGKEWYNIVDLPNTSNPFHNSYDGYYSIQIDKEGKVAFTTVSGETVTGTLTTSDKSRGAIKVIIQFANGKTATGTCRKNDLERFFYFQYDGEYYSFSGTRGYSKEEMARYRAAFIEFLTDAYQTGISPTKEELENNTQYQQFANYFQEDPGCGGPIVYDTAIRAVIEKVGDWGSEKSLRLDVNGESYSCHTEYDASVALVKNGEIIRLKISDIKEGECLIVTNDYHIPERKIKGVNAIYYIENG